MQPELRRGLLEPKEESCMRRLTALFALSILPALAFAAGEGEGAAAERLLPTPAGVLPIVEEPVTLKVFVAPAPFIGDFHDNKATKYWEGMTGVNIEWILSLIHI